MTKNYLLLGLLFMAFFCSCQTETVIESTPPTGEWEELIWVPQIDAAGKIVFIEKTFDEIPADIRDTLLFMATRISFEGDNTAKFTVRYGSGKRTPERDSLACYQGPVHTEYIKGTYTIEDGLDILGKDMKSINMNGQFVGSSFSNAPDACASQGTFHRQYDFTYEDEEKSLLRLGYADSSRVNIQVFKKK